MKIPNYRMSDCRGCNLPVVWLRNVQTHKMMPIDPLPDDSGNIVLLDDAIHFRVLTKEVLTEYRKTRGELFTSHFQTCVAAAEFRKPRR